MCSRRRAQLRIEPARLLEPYSRVRYPVRDDDSASFDGLRIPRKLAEAIDRDSGVAETPDTPRGVRLWRDRDVRSATSSDNNATSTQGSGADASSPEARRSSSERRRWATPVVPGEARVSPVATDDVYNAGRILLTMEQVSDLKRMVQRLEFPPLVHGKCLQLERIMGFYTRFTFVADMRTASAFHCYLLFSRCPPFGRGCITRGPQTVVSKTWCLPVSGDPDVHDHTIVGAPRDWPNAGPLLRTSTRPWQVVCKMTTEKIPCVGPAWYTTAEADWMEECYITYDDNQDHYVVDH